MPYKFKTREEAQARLAQRKAENMARPCSHPGCPRHRRSVSTYCDKHERALSRWGAPDAKFIRPSRMNGWRRGIRALVLANPHHPGLREGVRIVDHWLHARGAFADPGRTLGHRERLRKAGVTATDVVVELATVRAFFDAHRMDDSGHRLAFAMSQSILRLAPRATCISKKTGKPYLDQYNRPTVLREIAPVLMARIGILVLNLAAALHDEAKREVDLREAFASPFTVPGAPRSNDQPTTTTTTTTKEQQQ